jgi:hypothetical protein
MVPGSTDLTLVSFVAFDRADLLGMVLEWNAWSAAWSSATKLLPPSHNISTWGI